MEEGPPPASAPAPRDLRETILRAIPPASFLLIPILLVTTALRSGQFLFGHDMIGGFYYLRGAVGQAFASGRLPTWESHVMCGAPLLAGAHAGVLYPPTWLAAVLEPGPFWAFTAILHLSLAGFFACGWLGKGLGMSRWPAFAGALVFMLSGFLVTHLWAGHIPHISSVPWAAALMWRLERQLAGCTLKRWLLLAASLAMMILAGFPHFVLIAGLALGARLIHLVLQQKEGRVARLKEAAKAASALAAGVLLAAPQLLPTFELMGHAQRTSINTYDFATTYSLPPESLVTLLAPAFFGDGRDVAYWGRWNLWELTGFVGVCSFPLAAFGLLGRARQRILWAVVALAGIVLAMGHHTGVFYAFYHLVPGASLFRVPGRYLLLFTLAMAPLVAMGLERLRTGDETSRRDALRVGLGATGLLLAIGVAVLMLTPSRWDRLLEWEAFVSVAERDDARPYGNGFEARSRAAAVKGLLVAAAALALAGGALAAHRRAPASGPRAAAVLTGVLAVELLAFGARFFTGHPEEGMRWPPEFTSNVTQHPHAPFRIATVNAGQTPMIGKCQLAGIDHVGGYDPMMLKRYTELVNTANGHPADEANIAMHQYKPSPIYDLLGARYWILPAADAVPPGWRVAGQLQQGGFVLENPRALPRAFLVSRSVAIESGPDRLRALASPNFDPSRFVVFESGVAETLSDPPGTATIARRGQGEYEIDADSPGGAFLVLTEAAYPGWTAEVDGAPAEILRANHLVQAVRVPPGRHRVTFSYRSRFLGLGFGIALLTVLLPVGAARLKQRRASSCTPR
jgi:hypothetical protein